MGKYLLSISKEILEKAREQAKKEGISLADFIRMAIIEKLNK